MKEIPLAFTLLAFASTAALADEHGKSWGYEGENDPSHWSTLSKENDLCQRGQNQSPVNIDTHKTIHSKHVAQFEYRHFTLSEIENNGHTIVVSTTGENTLEFDGDEYELQQFHFHVPSEHTLDERHLPFEVHFVHKSKKGELLVFAQLFEIGDADPFLATIFAHLPTHPHERYTGHGERLEAFSTQKTLHSFYQLNGSLTTPPCSEGVRWLIAKETRTLSAGQRDHFLKALGHQNSRPVQKLNARMVVD